MAGRQRTADTPAGGGRADTPAGGGQAGATVYYGWMYMLTLPVWGKGGYGGSPSAEAGKTYQQTAVAVGKRQRLYSGVRTSTRRYLSSF